MRVLITGATSGLGLATTLAVAARGHTAVVAGRDPDRVRRVAHEVDGDELVLDLRDLTAIAPATADLGPVDVLIVNAAVQNVRTKRATPGGWDETVVVNFLAQVALVEHLLQGVRKPRRAVFVSSDTHDADRRTGTPPPSGAPLRDLVEPALGVGSGRLTGMERYVTSKALLTAYALGLARERPDLHVTAYNPGLMPGTQLDRDHPLPFRVLWAAASRAMVLLPFASTVQRSARALASLACDIPASAPSGSYVDFRMSVGQPSRAVSAPSTQMEVLRDARAFLAGRL